MRLAVMVVLLVALFPAAHAGVCDGAVETTLAGRSVDAWVEDLGSMDRRIVQAARDALRGHAAVSLPAIVVSKSRRDPPVHRQHPQELPAVFEGVEEAVPVLLPALECDNWKVRESAVQVLGWPGPAAEAALPALLRSLDDPMWGVRMQAAFTLQRIGVSNPEVVTGLCRRLGDPAEIVANAAATALATWPDHTLETLRNALLDPEPAVRRHAVRALGLMKEAGTPALAGLLAILREDSVDNRIEVIEALGRWDPAVAREAAPILVGMLGAGGVGCPAARLIARLGGESAPSALPVLIDLMRRPREDRSDHCSNGAYQDVATLGPSAIDPLIGLLRHPHGLTRREAVIALGHIGPTQKSLGALAAMLADDEVGSNAAAVLVDFGAAAVAVLKQALDHDSGHVRAEAARALGRIGRSADAAVPKLVTLLPSESGEVKLAIIFALGRIGGPGVREAIPDLRRGLEDPAQRVAAAGALARIGGAQAADVAPILGEDLRAQTRGGCPHPTAHEELRAIGPAAVPTIVGLLADPTFPDPRLLLTVLEELGPQALERARPVLLSWLDVEGRDLDAALRLQRLDGTTSPKMIEIFSRALNASNPWIRLEGAEGLASGDRSSRALAEPVLAELLQHPYEEVRARARAALARLRSERVAPGEKRGLTSIRLESPKILVEG